MGGPLMTGFFHSFIFSVGLPDQSMSHNVGRLRETVLVS